MNFLGTTEGLLGDFFGFIGSSREFLWENSETNWGQFGDELGTTSEVIGSTFGHTRTTSELLGDYQVTTADLTGMNI